MLLYITSALRTLYSINPLPNGTILDVTELKAFADDKINGTEE